MLRVEGLNVHYGGIHALKNVTLHVPEEKVVTLVGANGAGKSTLLRTVCGLVPATSGSIRYLGRPITGIAPHRIAREGIAMSPEGHRVFVNLSVYENLLMGAYGRSDKKEIERDIEWIFETFPRLLERREQPAATLSGGEQQMLALGRALMSRPKLLLLDEPSLGFGPASHPRGLPGHPQDPRRGHHDPAHRAKRHGGPQCGRLRLRGGERGRSSWRERGKTC